MLTAPSFLAAQLVHWRGSQGDPRISVVCQASYRIEPEQVRRLEQARPFDGIQAPFKMATDLVVVGDAPSGEELARLELGEIDKRLGLIDGQVLGPLAADHPDRRRWLGRHAASWRDEELAERSFPADADWRYWNLAPADQQLGRPLRDDERFVLRMSGQAPITTQLSGERAVAYVAPRDKIGREEAIEMRADTLWLDLDRGICTVHWRGQLAEGSDGVVYVALVRGPTDFAAVRRLARDDRSTIEELPTEELLAIDRSEALPFTKTASGEVSPGPTRLTAPDNMRVETGTLGPAEVAAVMRNLEQQESAPWIATPASSPPSKPAAPAPAWSPPPMAPPPKPAPTAPPKPAAVLSPAIFAAAAVAQTPAQAPSVAPTVSAAEPTKSKAPVKPGEHPQLLWFDPTSLPRVRAYFEELVDDLDFVAPDPKRDLPPGDPEAAKDHHHCLGILARGDAGGARSLYEAFGEASNEEGFVPPIALVEGELRPSFDEVASLERRVALLAPLAIGDAKLRAELDEVQKLLDSPLSLRIRGTADRISRELETQFARQHRAAVAGLPSKVEALLLEDRAFTRRPVFGAPHVRATLSCSDDETPVVVYLPVAVADQLPLYPSLRCRLLAEVHPQQDAGETHPLALSLVALGRLLRADAIRPAGRRA
ncbi:MAG: DUF2169 domain-containing protein [Polyangiaceae bacterium]